MHVACILIMTMLSAADLTCYMWQKFSLQCVFQQIISIKNMHPTTIYMHSTTKYYFKELQSIVEPYGLCAANTRR